MNALLMREPDTKWISEPIIWAFTSYKSIILEGRGAIFELEQDANKGRGAVLKPESSKFSWKIEGQLLNLNN